MFGGPGADAFVLVADGETDSIKDFEDGMDVIDISALGVTSFEEIGLRTHHSGKIFLDVGGEVIAVQGAGFTPNDLGDEDFVFA